MGNKRVEYPEYYELFEKRKGKLVENVASTLPNPEEALIMKQEEQIKVKVVPEGQIEKKWAKNLTTHRNDKMLWLYSEGLIEDQLTLAQLQYLELINED